MFRLSSSAFSHTQTNTYEWAIQIYEVDNLFLSKLSSKLLEPSFKLHRNCQESTNPVICLMQFFSIITKGWSLDVSSWGPIFFSGAS